MELDGNALAGDLREVFAGDLTAAVFTCAGCGHAGAVATLRVFQPAPGLVGRCPSCEDVVLRLVRTPDRVFLCLSGATRLELSLDGE
ncbi:DUF6510 family protein [Actinoplanes aureus]|jgi:hypothetical protein|uniref:Uncharacterized protein n=1 Tax=Actinoplanes aureus TaxID=2792083 RepID=A0A931C309_9ACTN|nr:DUF6510 family protein [Actinoplanes aureus]MBG0560181.1 hypothetical protein [Actinoplanes aureus]